MNTGQKLYTRAKEIIPGGTMLLSKRPEMFLPDIWPAYFSKTKGCKVWDLDDFEYLDFSIMGIGTNILGYSHPKVDEAVTKVIAAGNMSTFNCPEEVFLAEKLIELHPWANMVRYARSGGEANAIAIRIARAASGRDKVAICGYHGWHDWYLAANLGENSQLDGHLIPGLDVGGVPRKLLGSIIAFEYNDYQGLVDVIAKNPDIGVIMMEVSRNMGPSDNFLNKVRDLATKNNIVLLFDECTSGFRQTFGGLHLQYGVEPDMAMFGKALGNGYAITAIIGKQEVMEAAQTTFISSTFWTERIGPSAALATLKVMEEDRSWEYISKMGEKIGNKWLALSQELNLPLEVSGLPALISFTIKHPEWLKIKTYITQEMLKKGILAANSVYVCTSHTENEFNEYFNNIYPILEQVSLYVKNESDSSILLDGPICHSGFKRLN